MGRHRHRKELCSILNAVIRADRAAWAGALTAAAKLCRGINELCLTRRAKKAELLSVRSPQPRITITLSSWY